MSSGQGDQPGGIREYGMSWSWKSRTAAFLYIVEDEGFWNLATLAGPVSGCRSHWIIEGVKQGRYHLVDRCSPDPGRSGPRHRLARDEVGKLEDSKEPNLLRTSLRQSPVDQALLRHIPSYEMHPQKHRVLDPC
jgi:hypothetical protein